MRTLLAAFVLCLSAATAQTPASIDGAWSGTLDVGVAKLPLIFHFAPGPGGLTTTLDSPAQGASGIATTATTFAAGKLTVTIDKLHASYSATMADGGKALRGTFSQGGASFLLDLTPADAEALKSAEPKRPQTPHAPFPYRSEDVVIPNPAAPGVSLAATLTLPEGKGSFPAALLIAGSGPHDRDETIYQHKLFLVLADHLTRHGIAVLRADKRGIGKSTGDYSAATSADFASDSFAALQYLRSREEVAPHRVGLIGHSEGGLIAPMIAAAHPAEVDFLVLLAGPGVPGEEIIVTQTRLIAQASGVPAERVQEAAEQERALLQIDITEADPSVRSQKVHDALLAAGVPESQIAISMKQLLSPWYRSFLVADPAVSLKGVHCPVLALSGSLDLQVPPDLNLPAIQKSLARANNRGFDSQVFPGLNHLFQPAKTGAPNEYAAIETTMDPAVLARLTTWIRSRFDAKP